jgi:hypothetical protein
VILPGTPETEPETQKTVSVSPSRFFDQGAATSVLLAASPLLNGIGGRYFEDCNEAPIVRQRPADFSGGVAPYALDPANAERLWSIALKLIAVRT